MANDASVLRGCIYGLAIGDAFGVPYEFKPRGSFECCRMMVGHGTHGKPAGTWSDDTSMTLATCDSIRELGRIDTSDMRKRFERWMFDGDYTVDGVFDCGATTARALRSRKGCAGERDNGNGSLMRIAPLAFTDATDTEIWEVSAITHAHPLSTTSCVDFVHALRMLNEGQSPTKVALSFGVDVCRHINAVKSGGFVVDTFDAALWCLANTSSFEDCVILAVKLGGDTDTTAAVAGAAAGTVYGFDSIPTDWVRVLRAKKLIDSCLF